MFSYISSIEQLGNFIEDLIQTEHICLDVETTGKDFLLDKLLLIQIKINGHIYIFNVEKLGSKFIRYIIELIQDTHKLVIGHNIKFDLNFILVNTEILLTNIFDTSICEIIIHNGQAGEKRYPSYAELVLKYLSVEVEKDTRNSFINFNGSEFTEQQLIYSALDVAYLESIYNIQKELHLQPKIVDLEMKLLPVIVSMETTGIKLDKEKWNNLRVKAKETADSLEKEIKSFFIGKIHFTEEYNLQQALDYLNIPYKDTKVNLSKIQNISANLCIDFIRDSINLNSPLQMKTLLNICGYNLKSTGEEALNELNTEDWIIKSILSYRQFRKLETSFGQNFIDRVHPVTNRIHANINQYGAQSGRLSIDKPPLQTIKNSAEYRSCFVPEPGYLFLSVDYSQEEFRLAGAISKEPKIIDAYKKDKDMHIATAALLNKISMDEVNKDQRNQAKTVNFSILYGTSAYGMSLKQGIKENEAQEIIDLFYSGYPTLYQFQKKFKEAILEKGYSTTLLGRRRYFTKSYIFDDIKKVDKENNRFKREGFNHIIQGTGGDIIKESLSRIFYENPFGKSLKIVLTVHDEIDFEIREDLSRECIQFIERIMLECEQKYLGEIPAKVEYKVGKIWEH